MLVISNRPRASRSADLKLLGPITPWIVLHSVQLLFLIGQSYDFWRAYSLFVARVASLRPCGAKVQMMLLGTQINYMSDESHLIIIITRPNFCLSPTFDQKKADLPFWNKIPTLKHWNGILRFSLAKRSCLISLQPIRIRATNTFAALAFLVWPERRHVLVCHSAALIDNINYYWDVEIQCNSSTYRLNRILSAICNAAFSVWNLEFELPM